MSDRPRHREPLAIIEEAPDTPVGEHTHQQPRSSLLLVVTGVTVVLLIVTGWLLYTTYTLQKGQAETTAYIEGRGAARDAENQRLNDRIDSAVCSLLDSLPAGPLLDPQRSQYGCGPGIPLADLDPNVAQNLADILGQTTVTAPTPAAADELVPTSAPNELPPGAPAGAQPSPMGEAPITAAPVSPTPSGPTTPPAATTAPPLVDLSTVTDRVCNALGICL